MSSGAADDGEVIVLEAVLHVLADARSIVGVDLQEGGGIDTAIGLPIAPTGRFAGQTSLQVAVSQDQYERYHADTEPRQSLG
ncbi:MAG: hypothetical protein KJO07_13965, partial [Deltaproteobacteria bacterium]|nr:hypothetical protein [Deltaproteobacteria bacterium]